MSASDRSSRKRWYASAISLATISTVAIAVGAVPHAFKAGDTLTAADLNGNFTALEQRLTAVEFRTIARAHGTGPNDATASGAIASRHLQYTKVQDATGLRIAWSDNVRCYGQAVSCEWEIKIDGASCPTPGPLRFDVYNDTGAVTNILRPQTFVATCFGISQGPHTIQVYVTAPASNPAGGAGATNPGAAYTGWNAAYWLIEVEEVN